MAKLNRLFILFLIAGFPAAAQVEKLDTDRPDQTESAFTVPRHYFQAELGFNKENLFEKNYDLIYPIVLLKYGFNRFELRLEATYKSSYEHLIPNPKWVSGLDPVEIGFKAALWEQRRLLPKTSLIVHLAIPAFAMKAFKTDHAAPSFRFTFQNSINDKIGIGYNLGAEWDGYTSIPSWIYTLATGFNLSERWYSYVEAFGSVRKNETAQHNLDAGIAYYLSNDMKIDLSAGVGISEAAPKNYVALGFSFCCNTKKNKPISSSMH